MSDRPYAVERPSDVRRRWDTCAVAGLDPTRGSEWSLTRWKALRELIVGWYGNRDVAGLVEERIGWMDPVQRMIVERHFATWRAMFPIDSEVEVVLEPASASVFDHERRVELKVAPTFGFRHPDGGSEWVRLRTGRTFSPPEDTAVLAAGGEDGVVLDALVDAGVAEEIRVPDKPATVIQELFDLSARSIDRRADRHPGPWCFPCVSAARCGQYPLVEGGRVYASTRSLNVSKTQLGWLDTCHRRVAWDRLHSVPWDDGEDDEGHPASTGIAFHRMAAAAAVSDAPDEVVAAACRSVAPSEASELQRLWANHLVLWDGDGPPEARATEYPVGLTILTPGVHIDRRGRRSEQPVAVTLIGILDITGREPDTTPMVVEHRTGASPTHAPFELDLYAVSTAEYLRATTGATPERVAVHLHALGPEQPECIRTVVDEKELAAGRSRLEGAARTMAGWDPENTLDPAFSVGRWCERCHHRSLCETFR